MIRVFPMQDGPPIPYQLAEIIHAAYVRLHGQDATIAKVSERGGFGWNEVPLIFSQVRKKDREFHKKLMDMARTLIIDEESLIVNTSRDEVMAALDQGPAPIKPPLPQLIPDTEPDHWEAHKADRVAVYNETANAQITEAPKAPLTIVCWKWSSDHYKVRFEAHHVNVLAKMIKRHYKSPYRMVCITDEPKGITECETHPLWTDHSKLPNISGKHLPSCYRRLKIFSKEVAAELNAERILSIDLDVVLTGDVSGIFNRPDPFVGWKVPGVHVAEVYNGSMVLFTAGLYDWIWTTFDPVKSPLLAKQAGYQGSDQGWISYCLKAREPGWGRHDGVFSYPREIRHFMGLPNNARMVIFHGQRKPWDTRYSRDRHWIMKHYK